MERDNEGITKVLAMTVASIVIILVIALYFKTKYETVEISSKINPDLVILEQVAPDGTVKNIELEQGFKYNLKYYEELPIKEK